MYDFARIEKKWQAHWEKNKSFRCDRVPSKPKYYILDMFPYPSGAGLHVGHCEGYTATDILARYKRMQGFDVLHPMGWDSFGLPAENYAVKTGIHPAVVTAKNIEAFRAQLKSLGFSYDWDREVTTSDPAYYRWTQWLFMELYKRNLAYETKAQVNWCEALGCVLANEEVVDGLSEVGGHPVVRRPMVQWALKITHYADRLLEDLEDLDWPESIKELQRNWIGRSPGASITLALEGGRHSLDVFSTRPDTLFGATFAAIAPEHPLVETLTTKENKRALTQYREVTRKKTDLERTDLNKDKTGVFTGTYVLNPATNNPIPLWVADFVLTSYGTGAVMGVPAHDQRDWEFAKKHHLPIVAVIQGGNVEKEAYTGDGPHMNSPPINGLNNKEAIERINSWLQEKNLGVPKVNYKLRDWIFSRQRYWGEPFPILKDADTGEVVRLLKPEELPLELPPLKDFAPTGTGESPLARLNEWHTFHDPVSGKRVRRETHTMPQWAGSCWYYLRFIDPHNDRAPWDKNLEAHWMPVDLYVGGVEHAVLHLLYARFWHKVFYDIGLVSTVEPFKKLVNQGLILGEDGEKMSKSRGNVVTPQEVLGRYGADALRLYEMFMGPLEKVKPWQTGGIKGVSHFLEKTYALLKDVAHFPEKSDGKLIRPLHRCIKKVTEDMETMRFNTGLSAMMIFVNEARKEKGLTRSEASIFIRLLAPFAPHLAEEAWEHLGEKEPLSRAPWPRANPSLAREETITMAVQVNGKTRATHRVPADISREDFLALAREDKRIKKWTAGKTIRREIFVPGKIANLITS